jgi:hypothetical protein
MEVWPTGLNETTEVCEACSWWQDYSIVVDYPCDAIRVLDAYEEVLEEILGNS